MAIFHLRMKKSKRGSKYIPPTAHLDYINRDEKYGKKEDLLFKEVRNLPEEFSDIKDFWKCAETYERKNSNLYRELEISLPREFTPEENKKIVDNFCENLFGKEYVYNYAMHNPKSFDGDMQPHVHIMFFERKIDDIKRGKDKYFKRYNSKNIEKGGWRKDKKWNEKSTLKSIRKEWETFLNFELEKKGIELLEGNDRPVFVLMAGTNIDRIVTFYKIANATKRLFLIDTYVGVITDTIGGNIPNPRTFSNVRIFLTNQDKYKILKNYPKEFSFEGCTLFYSMWEGYKKQENMKEFLKFMEEKGVEIISLHTSGHADEKDFDKLIKKVEPKIIIPVHTENSEWFKRYEHCEIICDKNIIKI